MLGVFIRKAVLYSNPVYTSLRPLSFATSPHVHHVRKRMRRLCVTPIEAVAEPLVMPRAPRKTPLESDILQHPTRRQRRKVAQKIDRPEAFHVIESPSCIPSQPPSRKFLFQEPLLQGVILSRPNRFCMEVDVKSIGVSNNIVCGGL